LWTLGHPSFSTRDVHGRTVNRAVRLTQWSPSARGQLAATAAVVDGASGSYGLVEQQGISLFQTLGDENVLVYAMLDASFDVGSRPAPSRVNAVSGVSSIRSEFRRNTKSTSALVSGTAGGVECAYLSRDLHGSSTGQLRGNADPTSLAAGDSTAGSNSN
jgi:hypothetical protein